MALPENTLSTFPIFSEFLDPESRLYDPLRDYELGGVDIEDGTQGMEVKVWVSWADAFGQVWIAPDDDQENKTLLFTAPGIQNLSVSFDRNMQPVIAYVQSGVLKLYWYDSALEDYTTSTFSGTGPKVVHDDKRAVESSRSDVLFFYLRGGLAYYRQQRDRYSIERSLGAVNPGATYIEQVGMGRNWRIQLKVR